MTDKRHSEPENEEAREEENSEVSLVPLYSPLDVSRGLQAYRRGDVVLYTVRGEPQKVHDLIEELDQQGINDVVALVSHSTDSQTVEEVADAIVKSREDKNEEDRDAKD